MNNNIFVLRAKLDKENRIRDDFHVVIYIHVGDFKNCVGNDSSQVITSAQGVIYVNVFMDSYVKRGTGEYFEKKSEVKMHTKLVNLTMAKVVNPNTC